MVKNLKNTLFNSKSRDLRRFSPNLKLNNKEYLKSVGITKTKGSYNSYVHSYKVLQKLITKKSKLEDIAIKELQNSFITDLEFFLSSQV